MWVVVLPVCSMSFIDMPERCRHHFRSLRFYLFNFYFLKKNDSNLKHLQRKMTCDSLFTLCYTSLFLLPRWPRGPNFLLSEDGRREGRCLEDCRGRCDGRESNSAVLQELGEICGRETNSEKEREREGVRGQERWCVVAKQRLITKSPSIMLVVPCLPSRPGSLSLSLCLSHKHTHIYTQTHSRARAHTHRFLYFHFNYLIKGNKRTGALWIWKRGPEEWLGCSCVGFCCFI